MLKKFLLGIGFTILALAIFVSFEFYGPPLVVSELQLLAIISGWVITYYVLLRVQRRQQENRINHEIYKDFSKSLDQYEARLIDLKTALRFLLSFYQYPDHPKFQQGFEKWYKESSDLSNLNFGLVLQKWETYEIFLQNLELVRDDLIKLNLIAKIYGEELFLVSTPEELLEKKRETAKLIEEFSGIIDVQIGYFINVKRALQNYFYKRIDLQPIFIEGARMEEDVIEATTNRAIAITDKRNKEQAPTWDFDNQLEVLKRPFSKYFKVS